MVALFGPTGIGKTSVALALAERLRVRGEDPVAISADALQVYAGLETLTGAPGPAERAALEHRLVGVVPVQEEFSAGRYAAIAHAEVDGALAAGRYPIVVGGTGLYLRAAVAELTLRPPAPPELRRRLERTAEERGVPALHAELAAAAPAVASTIAPTDRSRVVRALELARMGTSAPDRNELWSAGMRHPTLLVGLIMDREQLYARIDARVEAIVAAGAAAEVRRAEAAGASRTARKALGYAELLAGDVEAMKRRTRNYAKRQLTWMRRLEGVVTIDVTGRKPVEVAAQIDAVVADRSGLRGDAV